VVEVQVRIILAEELQRKLHVQPLQELAEVVVQVITLVIRLVLVVMVDREYSFSSFLFQEPKITSHSQPPLV
jgi:hypothetical protein